MIGGSVKPLRLPSLNVQSYQHCHAKTMRRLIPELFAHAVYCVHTYGCNGVVLQATDTDILYQCNVLLCSNILKDLLHQKVNCIPVHSIVSDSENLRVYKSLNVMIQLATHLTATREVCLIYPLVI